MIKSAAVLGLTLQRGTMLGAKSSLGLGHHLVPGFPLVLELSARRITAGERMGAPCFSSSLPLGLPLPLGRGWDRSHQPQRGG